MGGGSYDRDVGSSSSSGGFSFGGTSSAGAKSAMGTDGMDPSTSPLDRIVRSETESPIVLGFDVTGSNIEFARIVYDKAPMLHGQIEQKKYLTDFDICFAAIGDATCDEAPLQVCDFAYGIDLDNQIKKLWLEGRGGGQTTESYELAAYYFANKCEMPKAKLPFMFFIADESPYKMLRKDIIETYIGDNKSENLDSTKIFEKLFQKFQGNVYVLHNPYGGTSRPDRDVTENVRDNWRMCFGPKYAQNIIPIKDEKSVVDVILGVISMVSGARSMDAYTKDLAKRGQTDSRIAHVKSSLKNLSGTIVPYVKTGLPSTKKGKDKDSGAKRL